MNGQWKGQRGIRAALLLLCAQLALGCRPEAAGSQERPSAPAGREPFVRYVLRPDLESAAARKVELTRSQQLEITPSGERILLEGTERRGRTPSPEPLAGVFKAERGYRFIAEAGRVYAAGSPLGELEPEYGLTRLGWRMLVPGGIDSVTVLALTPEGALMESRDRGTTFASKDSRRLYTDFGTLGEGRAILQAWPEAWFEWSDALGLRFLGETFGASGLLPPLGKCLPLRGALSPTCWTGLDWRPMAPEQQNAPEFWPSASRALAGEMALDTQSVTWGSDKPPYRLLRHSLLAFGHASGPRVLGELPCRVGQLRVNRIGTFVLCDLAAPADPEQARIVFVADSGVSHEVAVRTGGARLRLFATDTGLLVSGICRPTQSAPGCGPDGLHEWQPTLDKWREIPLVTPGLPLAHSATDDGSVWAIGNHGQRPILSIFSQGELRTIDLGEALGIRIDEGEFVFWPGPTGTIGLGHHSERQTWVSAWGADQTLLGWGEAPEAAPLSRMSGAGEKILLVSPDGLGGWESMSAGLAWKRVVFPRRPAPGANSPVVACSSGACLVGEDLLRLGWGGDFPVPRQVPSPLPSERPPHSIQCRTAGAEERLTGLQSIPGAAEAARGGSAWSQLGGDARSLASYFYDVPFSGGKVRRHELLSPVLSPTDWAVVSSEQIEGSAVLRFRVPDPARTGAALSDIEVAWDNRFEGVTGALRLEEPVSSTHQDYEGASGQRRATPALLSVSGRGLYLRFHGATNHAHPVFRLEDTGKIRKIPEEIAPQLGEPFGEWQLLRIGAEDVSLWLSESGQLAATASPAGRPQVQRLVPPGLAGRGVVELAYAGVHPRWQLTISDPATRTLSEWVAPLRPKDGPPERGVTYEQASRALRSCTDLERTQTPRLVVPAWGGIEVKLTLETPDGLAPFVVLRAVTQGTVDKPCVSALEALEVTQASKRAAAEDGRRTLLYFGTGGAKSWLFRRGSGDPAQGDAFASPLDCNRSGLPGEAPPP